MTELQLVDSACPACGSRVHTEAFRARAYASARPHLKFRYCRCLECGALYLSPRIAHEDVEQFYPDAYHPARSRAERTARGLHELGLLLQMGWTPPRVCLDWGSGGGELVEVLRTLGFEAYGYEAYGTAGASSAGTLRRRDELEEVLPRVECISFLDVLEHLEDPAEVLRFLADRTRAALYVFAPRGDSLEVERFGARAYIVQAPNHVFLPTERSLQALAARTGWQMELPDQPHTEFWALNWRITLGLPVFAAQGSSRLWDRLAWRLAERLARHDQRVARGASAHLAAILTRP